MPKELSQLRVLLAQIREDPETRQEEYLQFVARSGLLPEQIYPFDLFKTPTFDADILIGYDALFIGGSSDASVTQPERYPFVPSLCELLIFCRNQQFPVFASCFGFQAAVVAFGGQVIVDRDRQELGTFEIQLSEEARQDVLLGDLPDRIWGVVGHQERAIQLPSGTTILASTPLCEYHAFRFIDSPFYAFQFHPEMAHTDLMVRLRRYRSRYIDDHEALAKIEEQLQATPEANSLIRKFLTHFC
ncbi:MAG: type 1 glutamine amidotransferase [Anaerolineae bacterium]|nr:type 1 glutamine amidotransferase [Gloeobacterales cyanobacterium ES-bin-313]